MTINLTLQPADASAFSAFGQLVLVRAGEPDFSCDEFNWWDAVSRVELGRASVGIVEALNTGSYRQKTLEQHRHTKEMLIPMEADVFVVLGHPEAIGTDGRVTDADGFAAFCVPRGAFVVLNEGVWHQGPMTLADRAAVAVLYKDGTGEHDKQVVDLAAQGVDLRVTGI